jgi:hypothetical protein
MSSSTTLRVVTTGVGRGPCPTPYPVRCRACAQSRGPGSDTYGCRDLVERDTPTTRALILQVIEELERTSRTSTKLLDLNEGFKLNLQ